ncbi:MAG: phage late control D family protein, partial [Oscillospiraceae bacterium]
MAKFSIEQLKKKYGGFADGGCSVSIDGYNVAEHFPVSDVTVQLTAMYEASFASFVIADGFDGNGEGFSMDKELSQKLKIGSAVTVSLGYGGELTEVFKGHVDSVRVEYSSELGFSISVTCLDGKGMMMNSFRSEIKTSRKKYSDAVKDTLALYSSSITSSKVTASPELTLPFSQLNESDYEFVVRLAKRLNYSFYILLGKAYFVPFGADRTSLVQITPQTHIYSFSMENSLRRRFSKVVVVNNDEQDEKKQIKSEASTVNLLESGSSSGAAANSAITGSMVKTIVDVSASTGEIAKSLAQAELDRQSYGSVEGEIEINGLPELIPGVYAELSGFGSSFEKSYYIKKVTHRLSGERFTTQLELGGNAI